MGRLIFIAILFGLVYVLWDTSKVTEAVTDLSNTTNEVIGSASNSNTSSKNNTNISNDETDVLNQSSTNRTREIREDPVAYVNKSLVKLNEGKKRLEDRLFEQQTLITTLERRKDQDQKTLDRHNKNSSSITLSCLKFSDARYSLSSADLASFNALKLKSIGDL